MFCLDAQGNRVWNLIEEFISDSGESPEVISAARKFTREAFDNRAECDAILTRHAKHWDLNRLAMVDRNILRLAVQELRAGETPFKVIVTEAIKLAKEFSSAEAPRFINGILDAVAKEIRGETSKDDADNEIIDDLADTEDEIITDEED